MKINIKYLILILFFGISGSSAEAQELEMYLQIAAESNPKLQAAYSDFEAALQRSPQVSSLPDPTFTASAFGRMMETNMGSEEAKFTLMQMFPWFGTLKAREETENLLAEAKFQDFLALRNELFFEIKEAYAALFEIEKTIELKEENLEILNSYRELSLSKFRSGNSSMVNVVRVDIEREGMATEVALLKEELESLKRQFNLILNRDIGAEVVLQDTLFLKENGNLRNLEEDEAFNKHPELLRYDHEIKAYENRVRVAQKEGMPMLGLGLDYTVVSKSQNALPHMNGQDMIMPMVSVSLPIFRKKYKAAKKEAELRQNAAMQNREARENELQSIYEMTAYEFRQAEKLLELYDKQIERSRQANELLISAFGNNSGDFEEILRMNQDILMLSTQKITALKNGFTAQAKMEYLSFKTVNRDEK